MHRKPGAKVGEVSERRNLGRAEVAATEHKRRGLCDKSAPNRKDILGQVAAVVVCTDDPHRPRRQGRGKGETGLQGLPLAAVLLVRDHGRPEVPAKREETRAFGAAAVVDDDDGAVPAGKQ